MVANVMHNLSDAAIEQEYKNYIKSKRFPCYAAQAALNKNQVSVQILNDIAKLASIPQALSAIYSYVDSLRTSSNGFNSFALVFKHTVIENEDEFERLFWNYIQALHDEDKKQYPYDKRVSRNPDSDKFSFSLKEEAFFIIGLHPKSSRPARQFKYPTLVFNSHQQFEELRNNGKFTRLRNSIRMRDETVNGSINPMLTDYGNQSEVYQYTGKRYNSEWKCPYHQ